MYTLAMYHVTGEMLAVAWRCHGSIDGISSYVQGAPKSNP